MFKLLIIAAGSISLVCLGAGCAGRKASQQTARILMGQTAAFQADLDKAIKAESAGYKDAIGILDRSVTRESILKENELLDRAVQDFARQLLHAEKDLTSADIRDFLDVNTRLLSKARLETLARGKADTAALNDGLKKLNSQAEVLSAVKEDLEELQAAPNNAASAQELYEWTKKVLDSVKSSD